MVKIVTLIKEHIMERKNLSPSPDDTIGSIIHLNSQYSSSDKPRLYSIEFLRLIFTFLIIFNHALPENLRMHISQAMGFSYPLFHPAYFGVELFFIIAGFFLMENIKNYYIEPKTYINNLYLRIAPVFYLATVLCILFASKSVFKIFTALVILPGLSIPGQVNGWGDWYIGVYFWIGIFYFLLLSKAYKQKMFIVLLLIYFGICLRINAPVQPGLIQLYTPLDGNYLSGLIGVSVIRGLYGMGIGILASFILEYISFKKSKSLFVLYSIVELVLLIVVLYFLIFNNKFDILSKQIAFAIMLMLFVNSCGILSRTLNLLSKINVFSKYCYSIFILHVVPINILKMYKLSESEYVIFVFCIATILGILSYHLIEKPLLKKFKKTYVATTS